MPTHDLHQLLLANTPLLDVRSPGEFAKGAFPASVNIPLLDDEQRALVGTTYRQQGQEAALQEGWRLATPEIKAQRQQAWLSFIRQNPNGFLYCARGGLRSRLSQQLIREAGAEYPLIPGGFKALRQCALKNLENFAQQPLILLSGRTCVGKTQMLEQLPAMLDLEGLANHRGSAFGGFIKSQPGQVGFENALSLGLLRHQTVQGADTPLWLEDEGRLVGRLSLPEALRGHMREADMVVLQTPLEERVNIAYGEYVEAALQRYQTHFGEAGFCRYTEQVRGNFARISKRLGGMRYNSLQRLLEQGFNELSKELGGEAAPSSSAMREWIAVLLTDYYDPMYDYQRKLRRGKVLFEGERASLLEFARSFQS